MSPWDDLVSVALLGTDHNRLGALRSEGALSLLLDKLQARPDRSQESMLLDAAAIVSLHRQAGQMPSNQKEELPAKAELDELPVVGNLTGLQVEQLLDEYRRTLLPRWLSAVAAIRRRLPEMFIPAFLDHARANPEIKDLLVPVLGKRGRWLAQQNPDWAFARGEHGAETQVEKLRETFETGSFDERTAAVRMLRALDPGVALSLVESTWSQDTYQQKSAFLQAFLIGLSIDDEPMLEEKALTDKRKEVRLQAVNLLARISHSRFIKRMVTRVSPLIRLNGIFKKTLDVSFPKECGEDMVRDGIDPKPSSDGTGDKQFWLKQMLSFIPPSTWEKQLDATPESLLGAIEQGEPYTLAVAKGWEAATILHADRRWAKALMESDLTTNYRELMNVLPGADREKFVLRLIDRNHGRLCLQGKGYAQPILEILNSLTHDWSEAFARTIINALAAELPGTDQGFIWAVRSTISQMAFHMPLSTLSIAEAALPIGKPEAADLEAAMQKFLTAGQFRQEISCALTKEKG